LRQRLSRAAFACACVALAAAACNKGAARDALAEVEQSLAAARPELQEYAPEPLSAIDASLAGARQQLGRGQYTDALRLVQQVPVRIEAARGLAASRKQQRLAEWAPLAASLQLRTGAIASRLAELDVARVVPRNLDPERLALAHAESVTLEAAWRDAAARAQAGELAAALRLGRAALARADVLAGSLGISVIVVPGPAVSPSPR
jgi:hypothetical protein